ncbi:MAG: hypothetical protein BECKG1743F_GA0114225_109631, partial [Candidatus Kentron sp. G]
MFGCEHKVRPYASPNVGANLVFAHYARFALRSCLEIRVLEVALRLWPCKARWGQ